MPTKVDLTGVRRTFYGTPRVREAQLSDPRLFEDNPEKESTLDYILTARCLDGGDSLAEQHVLEGESLSKGGVTLRVYPVAITATADEKQKHKRAKEAIGSLLEQLAQCERDAFDGSDSVDYDRLLKQIDQIKLKVREIALSSHDS